MAFPSGGFGSKSTWDWIDQRYEPDTVHDAGGGATGPSYAPGAVSMSPAGGQVSGLGGILPTGLVPDFGLGSDPLIGLPWWLWIAGVGYYYFWK